MILDNTCTIVTAFYDLNKKKHSSNAYYEWINNFLPNCDAYMVIFTDKESYDYILYNRTEYINKTKIIIKPLIDFYTYKFYDYWMKDYKRDVEKHYHNPILYMIWNEKVNFIKIAKNENYFNTEFYAWSDIGMIRDKKDIKYVKDYPNKKILSKLDKNKTYMLNVYDFKEDELIYNDATNIFNLIKESRIGGGSIMCHYNIIDDFHNKYYDMLNTFMNNDLFSGKDQNIFCCLYLKYRETLMKLIKPDYDNINIWFHMLYFYSKYNDNNIE